MGFVLNLIPLQEDKTLNIQNDKSKNQVFSPPKSVIKEIPNLKIITNSSYTNKWIDTYHIVVTIKNDGSKQVTYVTVKAIYYDVDGVIIGSSWSYTEPPNIPPYQIAPFDIFSMDSERLNISLIDYYTLETGYSNYIKYDGWNKYYATYKVNGRDGHQASLTYSNAQGGTEQRTVTLPWIKSFEVNDGEFLYISAQNQEDYGWIDVDILLDGARWKDAYSSGAYVIATSSGIAGRD